MGSIDINLERYKIMHDHFKEIEKQYQTWMNYYSLFNGALLVAYYSIFQLIGNVCNSDIHWKFLALIAILGCIASYSWYLSAIGHYHWIGRWRKILMKQDNYPELEFNDVGICNLTNKAIHYHSTFKITRFFISMVLLSWIFVCYSSITIDNFQVDCCKIMKISCIGIGLCLLELLMYLFFGSDFSIFNQKTKGDKDYFLLFLLNLWCKIKEALLIFCFITLLVVALYTCQYG